MNFEVVYSSAQSEHREYPCILILMHFMKEVSYCLTDHLTLPHPPLEPIRETDVPSRVEGEKTSRRLVSQCSCLAQQSDPHGLSRQRS